MTKKKIQPEERAIVPVITIDNHQPITTSLNVADVFEKEHKNVLQAITCLEIPEEFGRLNFQPSTYLNKQGKEQPMFNLTRDGFTLLAMGFTGPKAMKFKLAYIDAFNRMEAELAGSENTEIGETLAQMVQSSVEVQKNINAALQTVGEAVLKIGEHVHRVDRRLRDVDERFDAVDENLNDFAARLESIETRSRDEEEAAIPTKPANSLEEFFSFHKEDLKRVSPAVRDFITAHVILDPDGACLLDWLFLFYEKWCYAHCTLPLGRNTFYDEVRIAFRNFGIMKARRGKMFITGIKLRGE